MEFIGDGKGTDTSEYLSCMRFRTGRQSERAVKVSTLVDMSDGFVDISSMEGGKEGQGLEGTVYEPGIVLWVNRVPCKCTRFGILQGTNIWVLE